MTAYQSTVSYFSIILLFSIYPLRGMEKETQQPSKSIAVACDGGTIQVDSAVVPYIPYIMQHKSDDVQAIKVAIPLRTMEIILACLKQITPKIPCGYNSLEVIPAQVREICSQELDTTSQSTMRDFIQATHLLGIHLFMHVAAMRWAEKEFDVTSENFSTDIIKLIQGGWQTTYADKYGMPDLVAYGMVPVEQGYLDLGYLPLNPSEPHKERLASRQIVSLAGLQIFTNLRRLYLEPDSYWDDSEKFIPQDFDVMSRFTHLTSLSIAGRNLTKVPLQILRACTKLRGLNLGNNPLQHFNLADITHLTNLEILKLHNTQMDTFDSQLLTYFPRLWQLDVQDNPVCSNEALKDKIRANIKIKDAWIYC